MLGCFLVIIHFVMRRLGIAYRASILMINKAKCKATNSFLSSPNISLTISHNHKNGCPLAKSCKIPPIEVVGTCQDSEMSQRCQTTKKNGTSKITAIIRSCINPDPCVCGPELTPSRCVTGPAPQSCTDPTWPRNRRPIGESYVTDNQTDPRECAGYPEDATKVGYYPEIAYQGETGTRYVPDTEYPTPDNLSDLQMDTTSNFQPASSGFPNSFQSQVPSGFCTPPLGSRSGPRKTVTPTVVSYQPESPYSSDYPTVSCYPSNYPTASGYLCGYPAAPSYPAEMKSLYPAETIRKSCFQQDPTMGYSGTRYTGTQSAYGPEIKSAYPAESRQTGMPRGNVYCPDGYFVNTQVRNGSCAPASCQIYSNDVTSMPGTRMATAYDRYSIAPTQMTSPTTFRSHVGPGYTILDDQNVTQVPLTVYNVGDKSVPLTGQSGIRTVQGTGYRSQDGQTRLPPSYQVCAADSQPPTSTRGTETRTPETRTAYTTLGTETRTASCYQSATDDRPLSSCYSDGTESPKSTTTRSCVEKKVGNTANTCNNDKVPISAQKCGQSSGFDDGPLPRPVPPCQSQPPKPKSKSYAMSVLSCLGSALSSPLRRNTCPNSKSVAPQAPEESYPPISTLGTTEQTCTSPDGSRPPTQTSRPVGQYVDETMYINQTPLQSGLPTQSIPQSHGTRQCYTATQGQGSRPLYTMNGTRMINTNTLQNSNVYGTATLSGPSRPPRSCAPYLMRASGVRSVSQHDLTRSEYPTVMYEKSGMTGTRRTNRPIVLDCSNTD